MKELRDQSVVCGNCTELIDIDLPLPAIPADPPQESVYFAGERVTVECGHCTATFSYRLWAKWEKSGGMA